MDVVVFVIRRDSPAHHGAGAAFATDYVCWATGGTSPDRVVTTIMAAAESDQDPLRRLSSRGVSSRSACRVAALLAAALLASSFAYALLMPVRYMPLGGPHRMLATVSVKDAMDVLYLAYAAFCPQDDLRAWRCEWCSGPNKHRYWLGACVGPRKSAITCSTRASRLQLSAFLRDTDAETQGYVAIDRVDSRIVVAYRGTTTMHNWSSALG